MDKSILLQPKAGEPTAEWRCFHCDETFKDRLAAQDHFGKSEYSQPACQINAAEYRAMEERMLRYNEEDSDLHRRVGRMESDHITALRREEEKGYARGLRDAAPPVGMATERFQGDAADSNPEAGEAAGYVLKSSLNAMKREGWKNIALWREPKNLDGDEPDELPLYSHPAPDRKETPADDVLRKLASYLGAGGYNAETVDAEVFHDKIMWGIEEACKMAARQATHPAVPTPLLRTAEQIRSVLLEEPSELAAEPTAELLSVEYKRAWNAGFADATRQFNPIGQVRVPLEPTEEMLQSTNFHDATMRFIWRAMIEAAK